MNYLAHIYLSGDDRQCQVGNFIGDFVKGNGYKTYPEKIREGIVLHRRIDRFTDTHPVVLDTVALLRPEFGRYSGIIADLFFDHLLASQFLRYAQGRSLLALSVNFYYATLRYYFYLPVRVRRFIWHFIFTNRLMRYASYEGLNESFSIMSAYKIPDLQPEAIIDFLQCHRVELDERFAVFFPALVTYAEEERHENSRRRIQ
jgi:acyl carrier protein phosphodiesterase